MTKKRNLCASNLPCPTWISPVEKLRCRILLGILGACESTAEWGAYMSQMRKDIFTDRRMIVAERDGGTAIGLSVQEIQEGQWLLASVRSVKTTRLLRRRQQQPIFRSPSLTPRF